MIVLGEGDCSGRHSSVYAAGEVRGVSANIGTLRVAGEVSLWDSVVRTASIAGELTVTDSNLQTVNVAGQLNCHGICGGDSISVMGEANADFLQCRILRYRMKKSHPQSGSSVQWKGSFKTETFEQEGRMQLNFDCDCKNFLSSAPLSADSIACERFYGLSSISAAEINAEKSLIVAQQHTEIDLLAGEHIQVRTLFTPDKRFRKIPMLGNYAATLSDGGLCRIHTIEGDEIFLEQVKAEAVNGSKVVIGDLCVINRVEYRKSIKISPKAVVNEVVKV